MNIEIHRDKHIKRYIEISILRNMQSVYNTIAPHFDKTRYKVWRKVSEFLDILPSYSLLADIGCGNGKNSLYRRDLICFPMDISSELLEITRAKGDIDCILGSGSNIPYKTNSMDAVISIAVVHHLPTHELRQIFFNELIRIVKPGGKILISMWADEQKKKPKWKLIPGTVSDYEVPWENKVNRFYHFFNKNEVITLMENQHEYTLSYEYDNWYLEVIKKD